MQKSLPNPPPTKKIKRTYSIDQSALYKIASMKRLASLIGLPRGKLLRIAGGAHKYKTFVLPEEKCPFTGKVRKSRKVEEPINELRYIHERIHALLCKVDHPEYAHGAVKGRSYRSNALAHVESQSLATFDMREFYPSTSESRVYTFWVEQMCCAPDLANVLAKLICYKGRLATGSPVSPLVSLYANKPMFDELSRIALSRNLKFTCYIDDITFSGQNLPRNFEQWIASIVGRYGHALSEKKTRFFRSEQAKHITGAIIKDGLVTAPHSRFQKMRLIGSALRQVKDFNLRKSLLRRQAGLIAEIAYLDKSFSAMAESANQQFRDLRVKAATDIVD
ncbi:MAG: RNA-directed DNA polymerase [Burkholderiales bacterium]|nr:RNA-directed DNA polymerase [Burkholderiales bacterium]